MVTELTTPLLDNQLQMQTKMEENVMVKLNDLIVQMKDVSYALYKSENPDTRFEKIYQKLIQLEVSH